MQARSGCQGTGPSETLTGIRKRRYSSPALKRISRRAFLGGGAAAAAQTVLAGPPRGLGRQTAGRGPVPRFSLGLASYTFREFDLDATLAMARRLGFERISLKDMHLPLDSPAEAIRAAAAKVRAAGLELYGCGVVYMKSPAEVDRAFAYARAGGMRVIIGVPDHGLLGRAAERVRETGIQLAIHNHGPGDLLYPTAASILERISGFGPGVGVCLDIGHSLRSGIEPSGAALACGPRLLDVHLKDVTAATKDGATVEAGRGAVDLPRFLRTLAGMGYRGTAAFEYEKDGKDPLPGLAESLGYVRGILAAWEG
jgi:inosose dehydratase